MLSRQEIVRLDKAHIWHPYTAMDVYLKEVDPFVIERAQGPFLFDMDGRRYLDGNASWWVSNLGHNHPRLVAALRCQAEQLCHCSLAGTTHPQAALLAEELSQVSPAGLERVFFSDDGSTAVEVAIKMAAQFFAQREGSECKRRFVALEGAFHGETVGASSLGGVEVFRRPFRGLLFDCVRVPSPADDACFGSAFEVLAETLREGAEEIAAIVVEPLVQGAAGMQIYAPRYLQQLRELCDRLDVLMIADEVFTGYGRTGTMWACDQAQISPDILCVGKGFSGGLLPMAATLANERVFDGFLGGRSRAFLYGHSYSGNPLGAAVAREVLAVYRDEAVLSQIGPKAERIAATFQKLGSLPGVSRPRSIGMVAALDLCLPIRSDASRDFVEAASDLGSQGYLADAGWRVYDAARRRGAYLRPLGETVYLCPALNIPNDSLEELLSIVSEAVEEVVSRCTS